MNNIIHIRQETNHDFADVTNIIEAAFKSISYSDQQEHFLVDRLRNSEAFIPELSIVAELNHEIVGHILFTKIIIEDKDRQHISLALAPVSVRPDMQKKGIGSQLINYGHKKAKELGYTSVFLIGHEHYYPRFGYQIADKWGIKLSFEVPKENFMGIELTEGALKHIQGTIRYPKEFGI